MCILPEASSRALTEGVNVISSPPPYNPHTFPHPYVSAHNRALIVSLLLMIGAALSLASMLFSLLELFFPHLVATDEEINDPQILLMALLQLGLGLLTVVVYIATIVFFLMWLYRSYENLPSFGVRRNTIKYTSGWAVGSFFIPFVSLVVPYRAVKELWIKSVPNSGDFFSDLGPPGFFPLWWAVWLVSNFANQIYFRVTWRAELTVETLAIMGLLTGLLDLLSAVLALMVVREIDRQQTESEKLIPREWSSSYPPPPPVLETA